MKKIILLLFLPIFVNAQDKKEEKKFGIELSGFVKTDAFYDTRQTISIREGHFLLYPSPIVKDSVGLDQNAVNSFNILSIQSRLKLGIKVPDAFGAKISGTIEADFFGNENLSFSDVNGLRLRHAFCKMKWNKAELLAGQYWHPMFNPEVFPEVISFNTGAPFQPFTRNPQIRIGVNKGIVKIFATVLSQRDFQGTGPVGTSSSYLRNSGIPNLHFQTQISPDSTEHIFGAGVDYKVIKPEILSTNPLSNNKYRTDVTLESLSALAFMKLKFRMLTFKLEGIYAQNAFDLTMLGGYAISEIIDETRYFKKYTNLNTGSVWSEFLTNGKRVRYGLFVGYTKLLGATDSVKGQIYARGANIDNIFRISPRIVFVSGKLNIAIEEEYTSAAYGLQNGDGKAEVTDSKPVSNFRTMLSLILNF